MGATESKDNLKAFLRRYQLLTEDEVATFVDAFEEVRVKKRQYIIQPNFTAKNKHYIVKGAFRAFVLDDNGGDHTISFAIEDWWITDYNSYIKQEPATFFVVALEDSIVLQISYEKEQALLQSNHKYETIIRLMAERGLAFLQRRVVSNRTLSAEARYNLFLENYPQIAQRLPQYALASFLGMSTEFLSKIRNRKTKRST